MFNKGTTMTSKIEIGTKIYYTGDMANHDGFFEVFAERAPSCYDIKECPGGDGRVILGIFDRHIGREYHGHCNPRFVTLEARDAFKNARIEECKRAAHRSAYLAKERA